MKRLKNILSNTEFSTHEIATIKSGHNNHTFLLEKNSEKFVARLGNEEKDGGSSLYNAFWSLKNLEHVGTDFVPKVVYYNREEDLLVETFVGKEHIKFVDLEEEFIDTIARQLVEIHSLDYHDMQKFSEEEKIEIPEIQTPLKSIQTFGVDRFKTVKELCPENKVINWIEPKLTQNISTLKDLMDSDEPGLRWGDIGNNTRIENQKVWFIDWEFSSIAYGHELSYVKIHSHQTDEQFVLLVKKYSEYSGMPEKKLHEEIRIEEIVTRVNDVIWAAMKWGRNKSNKEESEKYQELTMKRMKLYEDLVKN